MELDRAEVNISINDPNVTKSNGTAGVMSDIFDYEVPYGTIIQLRPNDVIAAYFKDASAEMLATDAYEVVVTDPNKIRNEVVASGLYKDIKTFDDRNKVRKFGQTKTVKAGWHIIIRAKATTVLVNTSCYFKLTALRLAEL